MTAKAEILIVDDEVQMRRLLRLTLESAGYEVREASTGALGLHEATLKRPDALILDLGLPDIKGLEVLQRLRTWSQVPVLILSVRDAEQEKVRALDAGADDYLTKPFGGAELLARLRVMLRRSLSEDGVSVVQFGDVNVDLANRKVTKSGEEVRLTVKEYALLRLLIQYRGRVITHAQILREIWGPKSEEETHYLRVYMTRLRQKLENNPSVPAFLRTESGIGYRLLAD